MKTAADFVEEYLGAFIRHMPSATGDNCRQAAELMIYAAVAQELREMISKHHPMPEHRSSSAATTEAVRAYQDRTETALDREWIGLRVVVWFLVSMWVLFGVWAWLSGS